MKTITKSQLKQMIKEAILKEQHSNRLEGTPEDNLAHEAASAVWDKMGFGDSDSYYRFKDKILAAILSA